MANFGGLSRDEFYVAGAAGIEPTHFLLERKVLPLYDAPVLFSEGFVVGI